MNFGTSSGSSHQLNSLNFINLRDLPSFSTSLLQTRPLLVRPFSYYDSPWYLQSQAQGSTTLLTNDCQSSQGIALLRKAEVGSTDICAAYMLIFAVLPTPRPETMKSPVLSYVCDPSDPIVTQREAKQSVIPGSEDRGIGNVYGSAPESIRTSLLPVRSDFTSSGSLAGLTSASSSGAAESVSSGMGRRIIDTSMRALVDDGTGALRPSRFPPMRNTPAVLECPFNLLRCTAHFAMHNSQEWLDHSLSHFSVRRPRPRTTAPPKSSQCCFCAKSFKNSDGVVCWTQRMVHVAWHHHAGYKLSHARPDFPLFRYLYEEGIIGSVDYRELGNLGRACSQQNIPTPPDSPSQSGAVTVINERENRTWKRRHDSLKEGEF